MKLEANKFYIISEYYVLLYSDIPYLPTDKADSHAGSGPVDRENLDALPAPLEASAAVPRAASAGAAVWAAAATARLAPAGPDRAAAAPAVALAPEVAEYAARLGTACPAGGARGRLAPLLPLRAAGTALVESSPTVIRQNIVVTWFPAKQAFLVVTPAEEDFWALVVVGDKIGYIVNRAWLKPEIWIPENGE